MTGVTACTSMRVWLLMLGVLGASPAWAQDAPGPRPDDQAPEPAPGSAPAGLAGVEGTDQERPWNLGVPMGNRRAARELFYEGNRLAEGQLFASAAHRYQAALAMWKHPAIFYNLALVQLGLHRPIEAYHSLQEAVKHGVEPLGRSNHQEARRQLQSLRTGLVQVEVICGQPGAEVTLNGKRLFVGPGHYRGVMQPGPYHLAARKQGAVADVRQIVLSAGGEAQYELLVRQWTAERRFARWVPWTVLGAGATTALAAHYWHRQAAADTRRLDQDIAAPCPEDPGCAPTSPQLQADLDRADRQWTTAMIGYAAGGALVTAGAVLLYLNRERAMLREVPRAQAAVVVAPVITPELWGVRTVLQF